MLPNFIGTGSNVNLGGGSKFVRLEEGKPIELIPLTGLEPADGEEASGQNCVISFRQYTLWLENKKEGEFSPSFPALGSADDPGALLGLESKFTGMMIVIQNGEEGEKVWRFGVSIFKQLIDIEAALGTSLKGHILRVSKKGSGMNTRYTIVNTGRVVDVEGEPETDLMEHIGPTTRAEIIKALEKVNAWPPVGGDPFADVKPKVKAGKPKPAPVVEDEDEEEDEEEIVPPVVEKKKKKVVPPPVVEEDDEDDDDWEDDDDDAMEVPVPVATKKKKAKV